MKGFAKPLAVLLLALAPAALTSVAPTQTRAAEEKHPERQAARQAPRQAPRAAAPSQRAFRPPAASRPLQGYASAPGAPAASRPIQGYAPQPGPSPAPYPGGYAPAPQAYAPNPQAPPVYNSPPVGYGNAQAPPPPGYAPAARPPNSLGAGWAQQQDLARQGVRQGQMMPLRQVITGIKGSTPGRLLDAGLEPGPDGRPAYRVRWAATGGHRIDFIVDAVTGAIVARSGY